MVSAPAEFGIATIWDWDVMIFAASHINEAIENRRKISPQIDFAPHDCLKQIGRHTGGGNYQELAQAIRRLHATMVITDIREADQPERGEERAFTGCRATRYRRSTAAASIRRRTASRTSLRATPMANRTRHGRG